MMTTLPPPKTWAITAVLSGSSPSFEKAGRTIGVPASGDSGLSPVEYLLLSAAGCMALSLKAAAIASAIPLTTIRVVATGTKPAASPSRLNSLTLQVALAPLPLRDVADRLIRDAQQMCTVTNTIRDSAEFVVALE